METVNVMVALQTPQGTCIAWEKEVSLTDDAVSIAAENLAYGLVEDVWGLLVKEDEK